MSRGGVSAVGRAGGVAPSSTGSAAATAQRSARARGVSAPRGSAAAPSSTPNSSAARAGKAISARPTAAAKGSSSVSLPPATAAAGDAASTTAAAAATSIYDFHPYFRSRTPAEVDVICTAEEELSRRQHWKRLFPSATALDTYGGFFTEKRAYNKVLSDWEKEKLLNPPAWITAAGDGPAGALGDEEGAAAPSLGGGGDGGEGDDDCDE